MVQDLSGGLFDIGGHPLNIEPVTAAHDLKAADSAWVGAVLQSIAGELALLCRESDAPHCAMEQSLTSVSTVLGNAIGLHLPNGTKFGAKVEGHVFKLGPSGACMVLEFAPHTPVLEALTAYGHGLLGFLERSGLGEGAHPPSQAKAGPQKNAKIQQLKQKIVELEGRVDRRSRLLQSLFDLSPVGVLLFDRESGIVSDVNAALLSFRGSQRAEVVGHHIFDLVPENSEALRVHAPEELEATGRFGPINEELTRANGEVFPVVIRGIRFPNGLGRETVWVMVEDVSAERAYTAQLSAARDAALKAREELDTAIAALPHGFLLFDENDCLVLSNPQMSDLFPGINDVLVPGIEHKVLVQTILERGLVLGSEWKESDYLADVLRSRGNGGFETYFRLRDGRMIHAIEHPTPTGARVGLLIDVTEQYDSAQSLANVIEGSQAGTWEVKIGTGQNIVNDRWLSMLGYAPGELGTITTELWASLIHPDDRDTVLGVVDQLLTGAADVYEQTYRMRHKDGRWVWIDDRGRISLWDDAGNPLRMAGVHFDISPLKEAQHRLEQIIQGAQIGTWQYNSVTGENVVNDRWAAMLGYEVEDLAPMNTEKWKSLVHPTDFEMLQRQHEALDIKTHVNFENEIRIRHKSGHWLWVLSRGQVTQWSDAGEPLLLSGVHIDISARKNLETELDGERKFLSQLMETSVSGILAVDQDSRIVFANSEISTLLELPCEVLLGEVCDPETLSITGADGQKILLGDMPCQLALGSGATVRNMRLQYSLADGRKKVFSVNAAPIANPSLDARVVCTVTDVTAMAESETRLRQASARAEAANRAKSEFLANMSHELRTPLNGVMGMAELLNDGTLPEGKAEMVQTIQDSGALLLSIVNDLLDLAKIESGKLALEENPVSLADLVRKLDAIYTLSARRKGVQLLTDVSADARAPVLADEKRLLQVMHNLLGNALKFTRSGSVRLSVGRDLMGRVQITVSDTGIGMTADQAARVFDEFTQADGTITRRFGGTGLGLPIVRRLVEQMKGTISLQSALGTGTVLSVVLPLKDAPASSIGEVADIPTAGRPKQVLSAIRALVAEDNMTNQVILRAMLARLGMVATFVPDGDEAVAAWEKGKFDILLLDISMPKKDGITALAEIREIAGSRPVPPAIAVTANAMTHHLEDYQRAGFAAVVAKPIRLDDLARAIATAVIND